MTAASVAERDGRPPVVHHRGMSARTRLLLLVGVPLAVAGVLLTAGLLWWRWDTARQPTVHSDLPVLDELISAAVTAAGDEPPVALSGVFRGAVCDLGPLRDGGRFTRSADFYTDPGGEAELIDRVAAGLPAGYQPRRGTPAGQAPAPLTATAGTGVTLTVSRISPGWVVARARTGCTTGDAPADPTADVATGAVPNLLAALGARAAEARERRLGCPGGLRTVAVVTAPTDAAGLAARLAGRLPGGARAIGTSSNRVAYRDGRTSTIVAASDDNTAITLQHTTPC